MGEGMHAALPAAPGDYQARRQRTRQRILLACRELMLEGTLRPTVAEIARRAGLTRRALSYNFHDLDQVRLEATGHRRTRAAIVDGILGGAGRAAPLLPQAIDRIVQAAVRGRFVP